MKEPQEKLDSETADATDISKPWDKDNQAWWDKHSHSIANQEL
jgi:hypothetical protein